MAADANVMPNGNTPAASTAPDKLGQEDVAANCVVAAPQEAAAKACEAPVKVTHLMPALSKSCSSPGAILLHSSPSLSAMAGPVHVHVSWRRRASAWLLEVFGLEKTVSHAHRLRRGQALCACQVEEPAAAPEAAAVEAEALNIREEASKAGIEVEIVPEHSKDAEGKKHKEPKKASREAKDVKDRRAPSRDKVRLCSYPMMPPGTDCLSGVLSDSAADHTPLAPWRLGLVKQSCPLASP